MPERELQHAFAGEARNHGRECPADPEGEPQDVKEEPESDHEVVAERIAPSIGCRPEKPASISCQ